MESVIETFNAWLHRASVYIKTLLKWLILALVIGVFCGIIGSAFHIGVHHATELRAHNPWLLWCLPIAGLLIVGFYKFTKVEGQGTNNIIDEVHFGKGLPFFLLPAIFIGTILTHLCGGSAGREGAALQMGGTIGYHTGRLLRLDDRDLRVATLAGMAAFFSALFGTPLAASVFAIMVISIGVLYHVAFVPCLAAALTAYFVSIAMGVEPTRFAVSMPEVGGVMLAKVTVLAALCALVSTIFCNVIHFIEHQMAHRIRNSYLRACIGGIAIIALTYLCGTTDYNGAGMEVVTAAVEQGSARPEAFALKLLFTAITLAAGFKGGEIVPTFCIGATFGCVAGGLLGLDAGICGALGLVGLFCCATNSPFASIILSIEMFGSANVHLFALVCVICFMLSGHIGLYSSQMQIFYSTSMAAKPQAKE